MKIKNMAASGLSGRIFYGTMETNDGGQSGKWLPGKQDVTDMAIRSVAEYCHITGNDYDFTLTDGRVIKLAVTVVEETINIKRELDDELCEKICQVINN